LFFVVKALFGMLGQEKIKSGNHPKLLKTSGTNYKLYQG